MLELLAAAQIATSDYVCYMVEPSGQVTNLVHLCGGEALPDIVAPNLNEAEYLNYYNTSPLVGLANRDALADGYAYCDLRQKMSDDELAGWRIEQTSGLNAQEAGRVNEHWLTVSVGTALYLCP